MLIGRKEWETAMIVRNAAEKEGRKEGARKCKCRSRSRADSREGVAAVDSCSCSEESDGGLCRCHHDPQWSDLIRSALLCSAMVWSGDCEIRTAQEMLWVPGAPER